MKITSIVSVYAMAYLLPSNVQAQLDLDDSPERERREYDSDEKNRWIFGIWGDAELSPEDIQREEVMWEIDLGLQKTRGFL